MKTPKTLAWIAYEAHCKARLESAPPWEDAYGGGDLLAEVWKRTAHAVELKVLERHRKKRK